MFDSIKNFVNEKIDYYINQNFINKIEDNSLKEPTTSEFGKKDSLEDVIYDDVTQLSTSFLKRNSVFNSLEELIRSYRKAAQFSYVHNAITEIVNQSIVLDDEETLELMFREGNNISSEIKDKLINEFRGILDLLQFNYEGDVLFEDWYVDGRIYLQNILDVNSVNKGIIKIKQMSPLQLKRIYNKKEKKYYYIYTEDDDMSSKKKELRIPDELVTYGHSGIINKELKVPVSNLHYALRDINRLDLLEDHILIYRIVRAPGRRAFYIDVGNLPQPQAKAYIQQIINQYRNKKIYNITSGKVEDTIDSFSMLEDYFLMRRNGKNTEIQELSEGINLGEIDDLTYFESKVYDALQVPSNRMKKDSGVIIDFSKQSEIEQQELKFSKFIKKLRKRFSTIFFDLLQKQLYYKNIMDEKDFVKIKKWIYFEYKNDSYYEQAKEVEKLKNKLEILGDIEEYIGKWFTEDQIHKLIFQRTDEEIRDLRKNIEKEKNTPGTILYNKEMEMALDTTDTTNNTEPTVQTSNISKNNKDSSIKTKQESVGEILQNFL